MAKLGFLGLGLMGYPMARNLLRAGHEVAVWSNTTAKAQKLAAEDKARFCATPKEVAENADVIFLCVGDTEMAKEVIIGETGLIQGGKPGMTVADCSTIGVSDSRKIAAALNAKGIDFLDAPVTGSTPGAEGGTLTFMIGGDKAVFERIRPLLDPMGKKIYYCGGAPLGGPAPPPPQPTRFTNPMAVNQNMTVAAQDRP